MGYRSVKPPKLSDVIMQRIEEMILDGALRPGQRLPPERELALQFDVSRPSLREALQKLAAKGLLVSRQGGGTFVAENLGDGLVDPLLELFKTHPEAQYDLLEFRHALEGVSAYYAALRSTEADREIIRARFDDLERYHQQKSFDKEVSADVEFHLSIAASTHNVVLLHMMRALLKLLHQHVGDNLRGVYPKAEARERIHEQHRVLLDAICAADPDRARSAAYDHLVYVEEALLEQGRENSRLERALRRADLAR